jgi:Glycosyltransferase family 28 C-terminal domain
VRIAICSLSQFTYVAEFIDAAQCLNEKHEVCYFMGFYCHSSIQLFHERNIPYQVALDRNIDINSVLKVPSVAKSVYEIFESYFFKQGELMLPYHIKALRAWKPDLVLSFFRDYAGMTAAEILNIPMISFGSAGSLFRVEGIDPPYGSGVSRDAPKRLLQLMWKRHNEFNNKLDWLYNQTIRHPYGLSDICQVSTLHSNRLGLILNIPSLSNKYSQEPPYIKYVGSLFSGKIASKEENDDAIIEQINSMPKPRVLMCLGTTHSELLIEKCLEALITFSGTVIVSLGGKKDAYLASLLNYKNVVWSTFFFDLNRVLKLADAVITVTAPKTVLSSLAASKPVICLPMQGEQYELAYRLESLGAGEIPCPKSWDSQKFAKVTEQVATEERYKKAAAVLQKEIEKSGGVDEAVKAIENLSKSLFI